MIGPSQKSRRSERDADVFVRTLRHGVGRRVFQSGLAPVEIFSKACNSDHLSGGSTEQSMAGDGVHLGSFLFCEDVVREFVSTRARCHPLEYISQLACLVNPRFQPIKPVK